MGAIRVKLAIQTRDQDRRLCQSHLYHPPQMTKKSLDRSLRPVR